MDDKTLDTSGFIRPDDCVGVVNTDLAALHRHKQNRKHANHIKFLEDEIETLKDRLEKVEKILGETPK